MSTLRLLQVVLARVDDADGLVALARGRLRPQQRCSGTAFLGHRAPSAQRCLRSRAAPGRCASCGCAFTSSGVPDAHHLAAAFAALGAQVDDPVAARITSRLCSMTSSECPGAMQLAQRAHQLGDVVEVQAGGGLVEQEQRALRAAGWRGRWPRRLGQEAGQLQALRLAAAEVGTGWPRRT
jgi:hypothetical protein